MSVEFKIRPYQRRSDRLQLELAQFPEEQIKHYTDSSPFFFALRLLGICTNYLYVMNSVDDPKIVGTILLRKRLQGVRYVWKIHAVYVAPELRGRGLGVELLSYAFKRLRERRVAEVSLKVDENNEPAIHLYRNYGFTEKSRTKAQLIFVKDVT